MQEAARPLRVLEVGPDALVVRAAPEQTDYFWCGDHPSRESGRPLGPGRLLRCLRDLRAGRYDLVVIHAPQYSPWHPRSLLRAIRDWHVRAPLGLFTLFAWRALLRFHTTPIVAVDLGDSFGLGRHVLPLLDACQLFFKRELPADKWLAFYRTGHRDLPSARWRSKPRWRARMAKLRPISYGTLTPFWETMDDYLGEEKVTDIFFAGRIEPNASVRADGWPELEQLGREGYVVDVPDERLTSSEFLRRLSRARIAWSPQGMGWDCSRHYEAAWLRTVPLINYPTIIRHAPLLEGEHCLLYRVEPGGLAEAARAALADKGRLGRIGEAAREHVLRRHTVRARAEYVVASACGRRLDGSPAKPADG